MTAWDAHYSPAYLIQGTLSDWEAEFTVASPGNGFGLEDRKIVELSTNHRWPNIGHLQKKLPKLAVWPGEAVHETLGFYVLPLVHRR